MACCCAYFANVRQRSSIGSNDVSIAYVIASVLYECCYTQYDYYLLCICKYELSSRMMLALFQWAERWCRLCCALNTEAHLLSVSVVLQGVFLRALVMLM